MELEDISLTYTFAFDLYTLEDNSLFFVLCNINDIKEDIKFISLSTKEKCNFIKDIHTNMPIIVNEYKGYEEFLSKNKYSVSQSDLTKSWKEFYEYCNNLLENELKDMKKKLKTEFKKLPTKTQKINYLNRCITDYKNKNSWYDMDEEYQYLKNELKFWEDYIEEPEQQNTKQIKLPIKSKLYDTVLTQKQTSLLACFLKKNKLILPNTSDTLLADCFGKMTGYSTTQINKDYKGLTDIFDISDSKKDYEVLIENLKKLVTEIKDYKEQNEKIKNIK